MAEPFQLTPEFYEGVVVIYFSIIKDSTPLIVGLCQCRWPGRNQKIHRENVTYFLDGGHTPDSLRVGEIVYE